MSDQTLQPDATTELDASVDALVAQMESPAAPPAHAASDVAVEEERPPTPELQTDAAEVTPESATPLESPGTVSPDALLSEISTEIEQESPGPLPTPPAPEDVAPALPPERPVPTEAEVAAAASEVEADLSAFEAPTSAELAPEPASPVSAPASRAPEPASAAPHPKDDIRHLDAKLAANAEHALEQAKDAEAAAPHPPSAAATAPNESPVAAQSAPPRSSDSVPGPADTVRVVQVPARDEPPAQPASDVRARLRSIVTRPLRPLAAMHDKLGEGNRQTVGYCAIITLFSATCLWGAMPFLKHHAMEPATPAAEFYDANTPAHGVTAPPKEEPKKAASHGEGEGGGEGGHAEKKTSRVRPARAKPSSGGHGGEGESHGAEKKTASSRTRKSAAKAESHGEH